MEHKYQEHIKQAYAAFNERNINAVLQLMVPNVAWPNGWEGGYVNGIDEVRDYWTRQWNELDPTVKPIEIKEREDGKVEVTVHQVVKDLKGNCLFDGIVKHIYTFEEGLIKKMEIQQDLQK